MRATWIDQLIAVAAARPEAAPDKPRFNPRPRGQLQPGRSTETVLHFLQQNHPRLFTRAEIIAGTGCTPKAVTWALYYLTLPEIALARSVPDPSRNERYLRYRSLHSECVSDVQLSMRDE